MTAASMRFMRTVMSKDPKNGRTAKDTHYANLRRAHRDQKRERGELPPSPPGAGRRKADWKAPQLPAETIWLYGIHTVKAAIDNPGRCRCASSIRSRTALSFSSSTRSPIRTMSVRSCARQPPSMPARC